MLFVICVWNVKGVTNNVSGLIGLRAGEEKGRYCYNVFKEKLKLLRILHYSLLWYAK
jgi:hypothetical protein